MRWYCGCAVCVCCAALPVFTAMTCARSNGASASRASRSCAKFILFASALLTALPCLYEHSINKSLSGCAFARSFSCVMAGGDLYSACRQEGEEEEGVCQEGCCVAVMN